MTDTQKDTLPDESPGSESHQLTAYKHQIRKWRKLVIKHLPETNCDRDDVAAIDALLSNSFPLSALEVYVDGQIEELKHNHDITLHEALNRSYGLRKLLLHFKEQARKG